MAGFPLPMMQQAGSQPVLFGNPFRHDPTGLPTGAEIGGPEWIQRAEMEIAKEPNPVIRKMYENRLKAWKEAQPIQPDPNVSRFEQMFGNAGRAVSRFFQMPANALNDAGIDTMNFFRNLGQPSTAVPRQTVVAQPGGPQANPWEQIAAALGRGGGQGSGPLGPQIEAMAQQVVPGLGVTSRQRSAAKNAAVGGSPNSFHLTDNARDFVPPAGMKMSEFYSALRAKFGPQGFDVINEGDHVHIEPGKGMAAGGGGFGGAMFGMPDYSESDAFAGKALGILDKALGMADKPFTATTNPGPMPVFGGDLPEVQTTDYSKAREGLEELKPTAPTKEQTDNIELRNWFAGIGQAMAGLEDGAGLGRVLLALGGGSLMGNAAGKAEVSKEWKEFEEKDRQYKEALVKMDMREAELKAAESQQAWQRSYQVAAQNFGPALAEWSAKANPVFSDGYVITQSTGKNGERVFEGKPYQNRTSLGILSQQAQIYAGLGQQRASAANTIFGATLPLMMNQAMANFRGGDEAGMGALVGEIASSMWDNNTARSVIGEENWNKFQTELNKQLAMARMSNTDAGYAEAYRRAGVTALAEFIAKNPNLVLGNIDLISSSMGMSQFFDAENRKVTTRTGKTGTTTTVTE